MGQRPTRPAVLAAGWRSRPGVVRVAAALLGLFGLLLALIEADQGNLDVAVVVTAWCWWSRRRSWPGPGDQATGSA